MLSQETLRIFSGILVLAVLLSVGLWLFYRGLLRARVLIYVCFPLSLVLSVFVVSIWSPLLPTWIGRLLFSFVGAAVIMIPVLAILRIRGIDIDEWDRRRDE